LSEVNVVGDATQIIEGVLVVEITDDVDNSNAFIFCKLATNFAKLQRRSSAPEATNQVL